VCGPMLSPSELEMECRGEMESMESRSSAGVTRTEGMGMDDLEVAIPFPNETEAGSGKDRCSVGRRDGVVLVAMSIDIVVVEANV
jgi:hypothetical protein